VLLHVDGGAPEEPAWSDAGLSVATRKVKKLKGIDGDVRALQVSKAH
jgi:hypothetical protein